MCRTPAINCTLLCYQETESCRMLFFWFHQGKLLSHEAFWKPCKESCHRNLPPQGSLLFCTSPHTPLTPEPVPTVWSPHEPSSFCSLSAHLHCSISRHSMSHHSALRHSRPQTPDRTGNPATSVCLRSPAAHACCCSPHPWNGM